MTKHSKWNHFKYATGGPRSMPGEQPDRPGEEKPGHEVNGLVSSAYGVIKLVFQGFPRGRMV